jgi:hypothetical protein
VATDEFELNSGATTHRGRRHGSDRLSLSSARGRRRTKGAVWRWPVSSSSGRGQRYGDDRRCGWLWSHRSSNSKPSLGAATSREFMVLGRINPDPEFCVTGKIEALRRIIFVKNGLRIKCLGVFTA